MSLADNQQIRVRFDCCGVVEWAEFAQLKSSATRRFECPRCKAEVTYLLPEFVALINKDPENVPHEITLRPVND